VHEAGVSVRGRVVSEDLIPVAAVNAAIALERPLLVKGEPGTGKTVLAQEIAKSLGAPMIEWHIKSTTKAQQGLYEYDAVSRLRDSQLGDERVKDIRNYIKRGKLWDAFVLRRAPGAADRRNRQGGHRVPERSAAGTRSDGVLRLRDWRDHQGPAQAPSSSSHRTTRRNCRTHSCAAASSTTSSFPTETMRAIIDVHFPGIKKRLVSEALRLFYDVRDVPGLKKKPSTSELLDWLKLLMVKTSTGDAARARSKKLIPPLHGALLKNEQDVHLFERLAFLFMSLSGRTTVAVPTERIPTFEVLNKYSSDYKVIFVGMPPWHRYEITQAGGSVEHWNEEPGADWIKRFTEIYDKVAWINPTPQETWEYSNSVGIARVIWLVAACSH
jgi:hypothetical protein